jgi:peptidyl-prolyl cis-trans isomerase A (cyclophilin A)
MTVANFVGLARGMRDWVDPQTDDVVVRPLYEDLPFHRVIPDFAIQTGDPTGTGRGGPGYTFPDEFSRDHRHSAPGTLSMANHGPNTNGSQFFITERAAAHLDFRHTVFGRCGNLDVVRAIASAPAGPDDRPNDPPILERVEIYRGASAP